ncbi:MAG: sulfatase-like hydrolase/transferase, partial [Calditrichae bacterium]|nr:sulfatase-like hydrolase/transferase [Calditrichia bacterium]
LNIPESASYQSPIARKIEPVESPRYENVILVLMENMSAGKMGIFGNPAHLTPHLDSLATHQSYFFNNFYSSGIHTFTGIYSTLFGFPPLLSKHP